MLPKIFIIIAVAGLGAFSYWTISPLFIDIAVEDELDPAIAALLEETAGPENTQTAPESEAGTEASTESPVASLTSDTIVSETSTPAPETEPATLVEGPFSILDTPTHPATGNVRLIRTPDETIVRYENYDGTNGPDLKVYLTNDLEDAADFVSLGDARGNQGNINYAVPDDIDIDEYQYVVTWCEAFGVLFDYAEIK